MSHTNYTHVDTPRPTKKARQRILPSPPPKTTSTSDEDMISDDDDEVLRQADLVYASHSTSIHSLRQQETHQSVEQQIDNVVHTPSSSRESLKDDNWDDLVFENWPAVHQQAEPGCGPSNARQEAPDDDCWDDLIVEKWPIVDQQPERSEIDCHSTDSENLDQLPSGDQQPELSNHPSTSVQDEEPLEEDSWEDFVIDKATLEQIQRTKSNVKGTEMSVEICVISSTIRTFKLCTATYVH